MAIYGESGVQLGVMAEGAGDTDGDGLTELLIGQTYGTDPAVLLFEWEPGILSPSDAAANIVSPAGDGIEYNAASAGDMNGDGYDDLVFGGASNGERAEGAGAVYLLLGPISGDTSLAAAEAKLLGGEEFDFVGASVDAAGDVDGDGNADLLIGISQYFDDPGAAYLVYGPIAGTHAIERVAGAIFRGDGDDAAGHSVAGVGDVDADGLDDILIGGPNDDDGGLDAGAAWLVLGASLAR